MVLGEQMDAFSPSEATHNGVESLRFFFPHPYDPWHIIKPHSLHTSTPFLGALIRLECYFCLTEFVWVGFMSNHERASVEPNGGENKIGNLCVPICREVYVCVLPIEYGFNFSSMSLMSIVLFCWACRQFSEDDIISQVLKYSSKCHACFLSRPKVVIW